MEAAAASKQCRKLTAHPARFVIHCVEPLRTAQTIRCYSQTAQAANLVQQPCPFERSFAMCTFGALSAKVANVCLQRVAMLSMLCAQLNPPALTCCHAAHAARTPNSLPTQGLPRLACCADPQTLAPSLAATMSCCAHPKPLAHSSSTTCRMLRTP
jgi:hypothetical protein